MPRPTLISPIEVTIYRLDKANLLMDDDAREPVHGIRAKKQDIVKLPAQVNWGEGGMPVPEVGGTRLRSDGYIVVRTFDMDTCIGEGQRLKFGDRIWAIGFLKELDVYITKDTPFGHWRELCGPGAFKYFFEDRNPTKGQNG